MKCEIKFDETVDGFKYPSFLGKMEVVAFGCLRRRLLLYLPHWRTLMAEYLDIFGGRSFQDGIDVSARATFT
jgi:hypothetical protein